MSTAMSNLSIAIAVSTVATLLAYFLLMKLGKWAERKHCELKKSH